MARKLFGVFFAVCALGAFFAEPVSAQNPFIIDGDPTNGDGSGTPPFQYADPTGTKELGPINGSGTKLNVIHTASPTMLGFNSQTSATDIKNVWFHTKVDASGNAWVYLAWERVANTGSGYITFEFEQKPRPAACDYSLTDWIQPQTASETTLIGACNPWANRSAGDFLIVWDWGGATPVIRKYTFVAGAGGALTLSGPALLGSVIAASRADGFTGDAAVNLSTDIFPQNPTSCFSVANIIPASITGNAIASADFKDAVLRDFFGENAGLKISNCGSVKVTKTLTPTTTATGTFSFRLARDGYPNEDINFAQDKSAVGTLTHNGDNTTVNDLIANQDFTLVETNVSSPWQLSSIICTVDGTPYNAQTGNFPVKTSTETDCVITNRRQQGTLTVIKQVTNDNGGTLLPGAFTIYLNDAAGRSFAGSSTGVTVDFDAGATFSVSELGPGGSTIAAAGYNQSNSGTCASPAGGVVDGATYTCTVTNDDKPVSLTLKKHVVNDNGGTQTADKWTLNATGTLTPLSGTGTCDNAACLDATKLSGTGFDQGTYSLSESSGPAGYDASSWSCVKNGGAPAAGSSIILGLGDTATCTITNNDAKAAPARSTDQKAVLHDSIEITGIRPGGAPAASVTFRLYTSASCATATPAQVGADEVRPINLVNTTGTAGTVTGVGVDPPPSGPSADVTYAWKVTYSGDSFNDGFTTTCTEETTRTVFTPK